MPRKCQGSAEVVPRKFLESAEEVQQCSLVQFGVVVCNALQCSAVQCSAGRGRISVMEVAKKCLGSAKEVARMCQGSAEVVPRKCNGSTMGVWTHYKAVAHSDSQ